MHVSGIFLFVTYLYSVYGAGKDILFLEFISISRVGGASCSFPLSFPRREIDALLHFPVKRGGGKRRESSKQEHTLFNDLRWVSTRRAKNIKFTIILRPCIAKGAKVNCGFVIVIVIS